MKKEINVLKKQNHGLFKVIDKCTGQDERKCDICKNKCQERITIDRNIKEIRKLLLRL